MNLLGPSTSVRVSKSPFVHEVESFRASKLRVSSDRSDQSEDTPAVHLASWVAGTRSRRFMPMWRRRGSEAEASESAQDDEANASKRFAQSTSDKRTDADSGVPLLSEVCHSARS